MQIPSMSIQILSPEVIDQIAAGEVVERPAHLVKELVENSVDAGATRVHVEYFDGGRLVKVIDNGKGMTPDDLPKAIARFGTSKITKTEDLWKLRTFGFRGEALASISSVSRLTITTRRPDDETAYQLICEYGKVAPIEKVGGSQGTTVLMENLFDNTPARLKFLKSDSAEHTVIKTTLKAMALSHPHVEFRVQENGKLVFFWPACPDRKSRVEQILEISPLYEGEAVRENVKAYAVFADPHNVAKTSRNIWLFAQNRWVQDRSMQAAVNEAYRNLLMHGEFPIAAIWVETDPDCIDVNIHPTKSQVKFQDPSLAFRAVAAALRGTLEQAPWVPRNEGQAFSGGWRALDKSNAALVDYEKMPEETLRFSDQTLDVTQFQKKDFSFPNVSGNEFKNHQQVRSSFPQNSENSESLDISSVSREALQNNSSENKSLSGSGIRSLDVKESMSSQSMAGSTFGNDSVSSSVPIKLGYWSSLEVLGQANLTYIVTQTRDKIVFVDQHAAHERVVFEKLMSAWKGGKVDIQDFLFPLAIDMSPEKVEALLALSVEVSRLGVHIEALGPGTIGVKAAPLMIKESSLFSVLDKMAHEIVEQGGSYSLERTVGDICATMACHSVVRAGQALSADQMRSLLRDMDEFPLSSFCPHGRPVSVEYPFYKLEKDFGRIV